MSFCFRALTDVATVSVDGESLQQLCGNELLSRSKALGLPALGDDQQMRMVIGALAAASHSGTLHAGIWSEMREEARGLLLLSIRREGRVSASTAAALNILNKPPVIEKYQLFGNRWTIPAESRDAIETARMELDSSSAASTGDWLRSLANALDEPVAQRPWWASTPVLIVLLLASLFVLGHVVLLARAIAKVHDRDDRVLLLPLAGLSASVLVGAIAIGVHVMSGK